MGSSVFFPCALLEAVLGEKAGIALPELAIRHIGIDALLHEALHVRFRVKAGIGGELGFLEYVSAKVLSGALDHGLEEFMFLGCAEGLGMDDDLMLVIHDGYPVIALDDPVGGLHGCALIVGDVALYGLAGLARFVIVFFQPGPDLLDVLF